MAFTIPAGQKLLVPGASVQRVGYNLGIYAFKHLQADKALEYVFDYQTMKVKGIKRSRGPRKHYYLDVDTLREYYYYMFNERAGDSEDLMGFFLTMYSQTHEYLMKEQNVDVSQRSYKLIEKFDQEANENAEARDIFRSVLTRLRKSNFPPPQKNYCTHT